jgi:hypothetical protein
MLSLEKIQIENARHYPKQIVDQLRTALSNGASLNADQSRKHLYYLDAQDHTYFIYVSPASGNITLIAAWRAKRASANRKSRENGPRWRRIAALDFAA